MNLREYYSILFNELNEQDEADVVRLDVSDVKPGQILTSDEKGQPAWRFPDEKDVESIEVYKGSDLHKRHIDVMDAVAKSCEADGVDTSKWLVP